MSLFALACTLMAVDGDTLRCGQELIRLIGIDAPELPGHCQEGRDCAPGDPLESKRALEALSRGTPLIDRQGRDRYDRTLARVRVDGVDLSCAQLASGHAIYRADWDQFGLVGTDCGVAKPLEAARSSPRTTRAHAVRSASETATSGWSYRNCAEARRAGAAPLRRGEPGYGVHMDGDGDGIACEPYRR
jgi:endonuclease YncB( thermonuclease family)